MGENTKIEWCDFTFNCWWGCSHVHAGCTHCYAETFAKRTGKGWGLTAPRYRTSATNWWKPIAWNRAAEKAGVRKRVFCASMADVFEDFTGPVVDFKGNPLEVTLDDLRDDLFYLIDQTPWLDWQLLTKRSENIRRMWPDKAARDNVWLGTSVSDQATADKMLPHLVNCRDLCRVLFVSAEPLLGPVKIHHDFDGELTRNWLCDAGIGWLIIGGESGSKARRCNIDWARTLVAECRASGTACFVKQLGARPYSCHSNHDSPMAAYGDPVDCYGQAGYGCEVYKFRDAKGGDISEWPPHLNVRQFPKLVEVSK